MKEPAMKEPRPQLLSDLELVMLVGMILGVLWFSLGEVLAAFW